MRATEQIRYSEAFKQQVVGEVSSGKFSGPTQAAQAYGIRGATTVAGWLRRYGRSDLMPRRVTITSMSEQDEKKILKQRVRELERALADTHMKSLLGDAYLAIACGRMGVDVSEFKKKHVTKLSEQPESPPPNAP